MRARTCRAATVTAVVAVGALLLGAAPVSASDDHVVVVANQADGASEARGNADLEFDWDGRIDQYNAAQALANCVDCKTAAVAFQGVVAIGQIHTLVPRNEASAANVACASCLTAAYATQIVVQVDAPARLTKDGQRRYRNLQAQLHTLRLRLPRMDAAALQAEVNAAENEFIDIMLTELVDAYNANDARAARRNGVVVLHDHRIDG